MEKAAGGAGTERGSGGMASKLAAAKIAAWSGVRAVIASASVPNVIADALAGHAVGTSFAPRPTRLSSRKLWIAFAQGSDGRVTVDAARGARSSTAASRCSPRVCATSTARSTSTPPVEIVGDDGRVFAKGLSRYGASQLRAVAGKRTADLPTGSPHEVVHRDDLVVLP